MGNNNNITGSVWLENKDSLDSIRAEVMSVLNRIDGKVNISREETRKALEQHLKYIEDMYTANNNIINRINEYNSAPWWKRIFKKI